MFPPLPLARELKVVRTRTLITQRLSARIWIETPQVSWLGDSLRLLPVQSFKAIEVAARPSHSRLNLSIQSAEQWHAPNIFALQSRGGDGFAPSSLARSLVWLFTALFDLQPRCLRRPTARLREIYKTIGRPRTERLSFWAKRRISAFTPSRI